MTLFQWIGLPVTAMLFVFTIVVVARRRMSPRVGLAWSLLWIAAATAIAQPEITVVIAHLLGIGRGTDLVFYLAILATLFGFFALYLRMRKVETEITRLVRHLALRDAASDDWRNDDATGAPRDIDPGAPTTASRHS
ncbi:MAG: DUF2304 domain-containing protein [Thermoanaerobaculia bacterium]